MAKKVALYMLKVKKIIKLLAKNLFQACSVFFKGKIAYPVVVNYPITNKCNYRCIMCNVWRPEYSFKKDMSPDEIRKVFSKKIFKKVKHVGISGGEPFVRKDIVDVVKAICNALPGLKSISIITNASLDITAEKVREIKEKVDSRGINLTIQVSINGIGDIYDKNAGVKGAFKKMSKNLNQLMSIGVVNEVSTTITNSNCNHLWEIHRFAKKNNIYIRYRIASLIDRLYNNDLQNNFTFTRLEKLRVVKFLENLIFNYEKSIDKQLFYKSLIGQLLGEERQSGCLWRTSQGVSLDPYGNLYFCFPKSSLIANINNTEYHDLQLLQDNVNKLNQARKECIDCTHDYPGTPKFAFILKFLFDKYFKSRINYFYNSRTLSKKIVVRKRKIHNNNVVKKVSIIGWYGTETLGDKAILGGIIDNLINEGIELQDITVMSLHPIYTELTLLEMGLERVKVVDTSKVKSDNSYINSQDLFIFGGGPLMDVEPLVDTLEVFMNAKKQGKSTWIYACGIGPLNNTRYVKALNKLIAYSDKICFRDKLSVNKYSSILPELSKRKEIKTFIDPAANYIKNRLISINERLISDEYVLFSFREWPYQYADGLSKSEYQKINKGYESKMLQLMKEVLTSGKKIILMPMHNYYIGHDDREYYFDFIKKLGYSENVIMVDHDYTPLESLNYFKHASFAVCLRFHSVVFAVTCNTPCVAIDYHYGKGKISGFMSDVQLYDHVYSIDSFSHTTDVSKLLDKVLNSSFNWEEVNGVIEKKNVELAKYMRVNEFVENTQLVNEI